MPMGKRSKRALIGTLIFFGSIFGICLTYSAIPYMPPQIGQPLAHFYYNYLSLAPRNTEPYGVYVNKPFGPTDRIYVAVFDGSERNILIAHPGGDEHRLAAMQSKFNLRVNAPNDELAVLYLKDYFEKTGFKGSIISTACFAHGSPASPRLGRSFLGQNLFNYLHERQPQGESSDLNFVSCNVASGEEGRRYIQSIADKYNLRVIASNDYVNWDFWAKWSDNNTGREIFDFNADHWLVAVPHEILLRRFRDVFPI